MVSQNKIEIHGFGKLNTDYFRNNISKICTDPLNWLENNQKLI